jgi:trans-2,3-dihydro-3-hydroxyanthranilate isomerase
MNRREWGLTSLAGLAGLGLSRTATSAASSAAEGQNGGAGRGYRYIHLDVFTDRRITGNQLLVFVQPAGLDADAMQALTRESNYSECTFVWPPEQAGTDHRVRIFGRTAEMPFAGHPTIGTAFALAHAGVLKPNMTKTVFGLGVGPTNIDLGGREVSSRSRG